MKKEGTTIEKDFMKFCEESMGIKFVDVTRRCVTCHKPIERGSGKQKYCGQGCYPETVARNKSKPI